MKWYLTFFQYKKTDEDQKTKSKWGRQKKNEDNSTLRPIKSKVFNRTQGRHHIYLYYVNAMKYF